MKGTARQRTSLEQMKVNTKQMTETICSKCKSHLANKIVIDTMSKFVRFRVDDVVVKWTPLLDLKDCQYRLCGFIYYGDEHFTARIVTSEGQVYYNDGLKYGSMYHLESKFNDMTLAQLSNTSNGHKLALAFYVQIS